MTLTRMLCILMLAGLLSAGIGCPTPSPSSTNTNGGAPPNGNTPTTNANNTNSGGLTGRAIEGLRFYSENGCAACHCNDAVGGCNLAAPSIRGASLVDIDANLRAPQVQCVEPCGDVEDREDHPLKLFNADLQSIDDLATYLEALGEEDPFQGENSQITRGFVLYMQAGCVTCHLPSAQGSNQGGIGQPIAGTDPDAIRAALLGGVPCHPIQVPASDTVTVIAPPPEGDRVCSLTGAYSPGTPQTAMLVDSGAGAEDEQLTLLSYFLAFIAPVPEVGIEPCENRPGEICTVAGLGAGGFNADNVGADEALLYFPQDIELTDWNDDGSIDLAIDDWNNHRIRVVYLDRCTPSARGMDICNQIISIAGTGKVTGADALNHPTDIAFTPDGLGDEALDGALNIATWHNQNIYRYPKGITSGEDRHQPAGLCDLLCGGSDTMQTTAGETFLSLPVSMSIDPANGDIYIAEGGCSRIRILNITGPEVRDQPDGCIDPINMFPDSTLRTLAGRAGMNGYMGDGGPASEAIFNVFNGPVITNFGLDLYVDDTTFELYVADSMNHIIRRIDLLADPPIIELFAGRPPAEGPFDPNSPPEGGFEDGNRLTEARFNFPANVHVDDNRNVWVADARNHAVRRIDAGTGEVTTIAGIGRPGFNGDNIPADEAQLDTPFGIAVHPDGRVFISDTNNSRVRVVIPEDFSTEGKCTTEEGDQGVSICVP